MGQEKILIVEDEVRVAQTLENALTMSNENQYHVDVCHSGEDALVLLGKGTYDLIVTDMRMAGMSGLDLVEQARRVSPSTRCILITAFGTPQAEERAAQLDVDAFLKKPFNLQSFVETVKHALVTRPAPYQMTMFSDQGMRAIHARIEQLRADVGGLGALLLDPSGQLIDECGRRGKFDASTFLALLGNTMAAVNELARVMQDPESFNLHFHEGKNYETYAARVSDQVFLCLILEKYGASSRIGMVWLYLRRAITDLRELFVQATVVDSSQGLDKDVVNALQSALDGLDALGGDMASPMPTVTPQAPPAPARPPEPVKEIKPAAPARRTISELFEPSARRPNLAPEPPAESAPIPKPEPAPEFAPMELPAGVDEKTVLSFEEAVRLGLINFDEPASDEGKKK